MYWMCSDRYIIRSIQEKSENEDKNNKEKYFVEDLE